MGFSVFPNPLFWVRMLGTQLNLITQVPENNAFTLLVQDIYALISNQSEGIPTEFSEYYPNFEISTVQKVRLKSKIFLKSHIFKIKVKYALDGFN